MKDYSFNGSPRIYEFFLNIMSNHLKSNSSVSCLDKRNIRQTTSNSNILTMKDLFNSCDYQLSRGQNVGVYAI